jgi:hypothetical protein
MYHVPAIVRPFRHILRWWLASLLGGSVTGILMFLIAWRAPTRAWMVDLGWISGAACVAIGQALLLPSRLIPRVRWILITLLGASLWVGLAMANDLATNTERRFDGPFSQGESGAIAMLVLGLCQAAYLRRSFEGTNWWIGAAVGGAALAELVGLSGDLYRWVDPGSTIGHMLVWAAIFGLRWLLLMAFLGVALVYKLEPRATGARVVLSADDSRRLLRRRRPRQQRRRRNDTNPR